MRISILLTLVALACPLMSAWAQQKSQSADDPHATVAPLQYQSVFAAHPQQTKIVDAPDTVWIGANRDIQSNDSMGKMDMGDQNVKSDKQPDGPPDSRVSNEKGD